MITIDLSGDAGALLPGETVLWAGAPASSRIRLAEAAGALIYLVPPVVFGVWAGTSLRGYPGIFLALALVVSFYAAFQFLVPLTNLLVLGPRRRRRELYQVTNWRVLVTSGTRERRTWSAYLDQIAEPVVRPGRDGVTDLALRRAQAPAPRRRLAAFVNQDSPFEIDDEDFPVLLSLRDAATTAETITAARQAMLARNIGSAPPPAALSGIAVPGAIRIEEGEHVIWAGRPAAVPWWFGFSDMHVSAFGLVFLTFTGLMCAWVATSSPAALFFFVPFALAGGGYPAAGRVLVRRLRIKRSTYVVTDRRLIATWRLARDPVVVQAPIANLLPPAISGRSILVRTAGSPAQMRRPGWDRLTWPVTAGGPPSLIGVDDPIPVRNAICAAQLAARTRPTATP